MILVESITGVSRAVLPSSGSLPVGDVVLFAAPQDITSNKMSKYACSFKILLTVEACMYLLFGL